jgi:hypothetical protein
MKEIWKHNLKVTDEVKLLLREDAEILTIQNQGGLLTLWEKHEVEQKKPSIERIIRIVGTGHLFDDKKLKYITSVQQGIFVWHIFEKIK